MNATASMLVNQVRVVPDLPPRPWCLRLWDRVRALWGRSPLGDFARGVRLELCVAGRQVLNVPLAFAEIDGDTLLVRLGPYPIMLHRDTIFSAGLQFDRPRPANGRPAQIKLEGVMVGAGVWHSETT